jgi:hypothetical protein
VKRRHSFNIMGETYRLIDPKDLPEQALGEADLTNKTIKIREDLSSKEWLETLLHELIHAKDYESGLHQTLDRTGLEVNADTTAKVILANFDLKLKRRRK